MKKKTLPGADFDLSKFKSKFAAPKPQREASFYNFPIVMQNELGIKGVPKCGTTQVLGYSDTGKTTLLIEAAIQAQKEGDLPIFIITENKFSFKHAKLMGLECEEVYDDESPYWDGDFIFKNDFENLEEIFDFMRMILDSQSTGGLPRNVLFLIDSIGSLHGKRQADGAGGNMHDAKSIADNYRMDIAQRIQNTKFSKYQYYATALIINQCYPNVGGMGATTISPYGGNAIFYSADLVILFGGQERAGSQKVMATAKGRRLTFGKKVRVSILKNHIIGVNIDDGKIIVTPHGIIEASNESILAYKKNNMNYLKQLFADFSTDDAGENLSEDDITIEVTNDKIDL